MKSQQCSRLRQAVLADFAIESCVEPGIQGRSQSARLSWRSILAVAPLPITVCSKPRARKKCERSELTCRKGEHNQAQAWNQAGRFGVTEKTINEKRTARLDGAGPSSPDHPRPSSPRQRGHLRWCTGPTSHSSKFGFPDVRYLAT